MQGIKAGEHTKKENQEIRVLSHAILKQIWQVHWISTGSVLPVDLKFLDEVSFALRYSISRFLI